VLDIFSLRCFKILELLDLYFGMYKKNTDLVTFGGMYQWASHAKHVAVQSIYKVPWSLGGLVILTIIRTETETEMKVSKTRSPRLEK
jgi:hypothetical protein